MLFLEHAPTFKSKYIETREKMCLLLLSIWKIKEYKVENIISINKKKAKLLTI